MRTLLTSGKQNKRNGSKIFYTIRIVIGYNIHMAISEGGISIAHKGKDGLQKD